MSDRRRQYALVGLFVLVAITAAFVLQRVFATVFFAITLTYVLYPVREFLVNHGLGKRVAAGVSTTLAFVALVVLFAPLAAALYVRRGTLFEFFRQLPETLTLSAAGFSYTVELETALTTAQSALADIALGLAQSIPALTFKLFLFTLVVYALLIRPDQIRETLLGPVPREYHDVVLAFHERTRSMLYGIYVLQAAVAVGTFGAGLVVFFAFGYESTFTLSVLSGILQFVPIVGPSALIVGIGATEVVAGNVTRAILVVVVGLTLIGLLPDVIIRPRLAGLATDVPASLYFIGFTGGTLSVGLIGLVAGPVVVAWLAEAVALLSAETGADTTTPTTLSEWTEGDDDSANGDGSDREPPAESDDRGRG